VLPFAFEQAAPQAPQFAVVESVVSQPFDASPSQLPNPLLQAMAHVEELQDGVPLLLLHAWPQAPQLVRLFAVSVSQPLLLLPSQSAKLPVHTGAQVPDTHVVVPCALVQEVPQAPQLVRVVLMFVSQPFERLPSQSAKPAKQVGAHAPAEHVAVPFALVQLLPQPPQLPVLVLRFASQPFCGLPSQFANPELQVGAQVPAAHVVAPFALVQAEPHAPQLAVLVCVFVSQPLPTFESQLPKPGSHAIEQAPREQLAVPFALEHADPQLPQLAVLVLVFTSQPFVETPSQLAKPELHVPSVHVPVGHEALPFGRLQVAPQLPQFVSV
jgi:hypothetical protein